MTIAEILETLCKFKNKVDVIIVNISLLNEILSNQLLARICEKLGIEEPPALGYFTNGQIELKKNLKQTHGKLSLIEYNEHHAGFPDRYISAIKKLYPLVNVDVDQAKKMWASETEEQEFVDIQKWLEEEGFVEAIEKKETRKEVPPTEAIVIKRPAKPEKPAAVPGEDYKKLYFDLKKKYDELSQYVKELIDSVKNPEN